MALLVTIFGLARVEAATISWTNPVGGKWSDPTNWDAGTVPGPGDTAFITLNGDYTVNLDTDVSVNYLTIGGVSGTQMVTWAGSNLTVSNFYINSNAVFNIGPSSTLNLAGTITSQGTINWGTTNALNAIGDCVLNSSGLFNLQTNFNTAGFTPFTGNPYYSGSFSSTGTFLVQSNLGVVTFFPGKMRFTNSGAINVGAGSVLALRGSMMANGIPMVLDDGTSITGSGLVQDVDAYIIANGNIILNGTFELDGNDVQYPWEGDTGIIQGTQTWTGTGSLNWNGGVIGDVGAVADFSLAGSNTTTFDTNFQVNITSSGAIVNCQIIKNKGTINWADHSFLEMIANRSFVENEGLMVFQGVTYLLVDNSFLTGVSNSFIINTGIIHEMTNSGGNEPYLITESGWTFTNTGVIQVDSNVTFEIDCYSTNGAIFADGTIFNATGQVVLGNSSRTSYYEIDGSITVNGPTNQYGNLTLGPFANIHGTQTWTGSGSLNLDAPTFYDSGVTTIASNFLVNNSYPYVTLDGHAINNQGTINVFNMGFSEIRPASFTNSGLIVAKTIFFGVDNFVNSGTMAGLSNNSLRIDCGGNFINSGTFYAASNSPIEIQSSNITLKDGTVFAGSGNTVLLSQQDFFDPPGTITANGNITVNGSLTFDYSANLQGTQTWIGPGSLTWSSASLRSPGTTTVASNFTLYVADDPDDIPNPVPRVLAQSHVLNNLGTVFWNTTNVVQMSNQASFVNGGLVILQTNCGLQQMTPDCTFLNLPGGTVRVLGGGNSSFNCPFTNSGKLDMESGTLTLAGGYVLNGTSVDFFSAGGSANVLTVPTLNPQGVLSVVLPDGFPITNGTAFTLINYGSRNGTFANIQLPALPPSLQWNLDYGPASLSLKAITNTTRISVPAMQPNGIFQFTFSGPPANNYWIQASTNLVDWITVQANAPFVGQANFIDATATNFSRRFYRGVMGN